MILMIGEPGEKDTPDEYYYDLVQVLKASVRGTVRSAAGPLAAEGIDAEDKKTVQDFVKALDFDGFFTLADAQTREHLFKETCKHFFIGQASPAPVAEDKKDAPAQQQGPPPAWVAETKKPIHSTCYVFNGRRWTAQAEIKGADDGHVEQQAYNALMGTSVDLQKKKYQSSWLGFVQNAPPCPEQCRGFFLNASNEAPGFVFHIVGDHGGYCRDYKVFQTTPFDLYFYKGNFSIGRPTGAPVDVPAAGPR